MSTGVLLAVDQALVRAGFAMILDAQPDLTVVGEACDGQEAIDLAVALDPDVVLMDVRMPELDGIAATAAITAAQPGVRVLVLTTFDLDEYVLAAIRTGASGFLLKDATPARLVTAIRAVAEGDSLFAPSVTRRLVERFSATPADPGREYSELTRREVDVLVLVAEGLSNAEICDRLVLSLPTVKTHVSRILTKLALRDRVHAVVFAYEHGIVRPGAETG